MHHSQSERCSMSSQFLKYTKTVEYLFLCRSPKNRAPRRMSLFLPVCKIPQSLEHLFFPTSKNAQEVRNVSSLAFSKNIFWVSVRQRRPYFHVTKLHVVEAQVSRFRGRETLSARLSFTSAVWLLARFTINFWLRYARWMFSQGKEENARIISVKKGKTTKSCLFVWSSSKASGTIQISFLLPPW